MAKKISEFFSKMLGRDKNITDEEKKQYEEMQNHYKNNQKQIKIKNLLIKGLKDYQVNDSKFLELDEMRNEEDEIISRYNLNVGNREDVNDFSFIEDGIQDLKDINLFYNDFDDYNTGIIDEPIKTETDNKGIQTNKEIKTNNNSHTEPDKEYAEKYLTDGSNKGNNTNTDPDFEYARNQLKNKGDGAGDTGEGAGDEAGDTGDGAGDEAGDTGDGAGDGAGDT